MIPEGSPFYKKLALRLRILGAKNEIARCQEELINIARLETANEIMAKPPTDVAPTWIMSFAELDAACSEAERMHRALL